MSEVPGPLSSLDAPDETTASGIGIGIGINTEPSPQAGRKRSRPPPESPAAELPFVATAGVSTAKTGSRAGSFVVGTGSHMGASDV